MQSTDVLWPFASQVSGKYSIILPNKSVLADLAYQMTKNLYFIIGYV